MKYQTIFLGIQQGADQIKDKLEKAPDSGYEIGIVIGTYLPVVLFIIAAYVMYYKARNRKD
jgi:hypothetical protein